MAYVIKPKGEHANFDTECVKCQGELTINHGRVDHHECERITGTLNEVLEALDNRTD